MYSADILNVKMVYFARVVKNVLRLNQYLSKNFQGTVLCLFICWALRMQNCWVSSKTKQNHGMSVICFKQRYIHCEIREVFFFFFAMLCVLRNLGSLARH